ncbi:hybrid-cluster NAD(P)-dependent oxidoreductase [Vibrio algivorus]|uniref:Hybrid-cluster NAD(P)-dependent oxidoreductase n=1 Tax=Vibrio algivorus TaxID=1667024 RepID=A0ABQ6ERE9_9VIBR|nr:hybrid-cluster NAD(P)-dependent oxidoreductase [Vibrio algivorus]GLT15379.1 hybrid-cluster NAD(P)-dependent oxidoreductase [Vibrio algivorus]
MNQFEWPDNQPATFICQRKWQETPNCVSVTLVAENQDSETTFDFIPGQFITLGIEVEGKTEYRAYSLSSMPNQSELQLTIKRVVDGKVSNYIVDSLQEGQTVSVLKPAGEFHIEQPHGKRIVLLSAGCGITPVMSMAKTLLSDKTDTTDIHFIHAATELEQVIYHQELLEMAASHKRFHFDVMLENAQGSEYLEGRLTQAALKQFCPDIAERSAFLCGPIGFMAAMQENLSELGMNMDNFYQESFTPAESEQPEVALNLEVTLGSDADKAQAISNATVFVPAFGAQAEAKIGSALIDALEAAKVPVIAACRSGICGSCKCRVVKGAFTRTSTATLTDDEIDNGFVLACSCQVESDVEVALN